MNTPDDAPVYVSQAGEGSCRPNTNTSPTPLTVGERERLLLQACESVTEAVETFFDEVSPGDHDAISCAVYEALEPALLAQPDLSGEVRRLQANLAVVLDRAVYSDSYGVLGSDFEACVFCTGGGAPGVAMKHDAACPITTYGAEADQFWEDYNAAEAEVTRLSGENARLRKGLEVIADGEGFADVIARQTLSADPEASLIDDGSFRASPSTPGIEPEQARQVGEQRGLDEAWRSVDACGGAYSADDYASGYAQAHGKALDAACAAIEQLGGRQS